jgi:SAM-dependent methyltransferase
MAERVPFDDFADVYEAWCRSAAPVTDANRRFYAEEYRAAGTPVVELGIGDVRIAIEAARDGVDVTGVDSSSEMLARCRARFEEEGLLERLHLVQADFLELELSEPARFVAIPFHTIGALVGLDAKRAFLERIHASLAPGGRLVFDHFVFDGGFAAQRNGVPELREELRGPDGRDLLLWVACTFDLERQAMRIVAWTDEVEPDGTVSRRRYRRVDFSWIEVEDARRLLEETGFEIEHLWGSFDREAFVPGRSGHQIWVARRPG